MGGMGTLGGRVANARGDWWRPLTGTRQEETMANTGTGEHRYEQDSSAEDLGEDVLALASVAQADAPRLRAAPRQRSAGAPHRRSGLTTAPLPWRRVGTLGGARRAAVAKRGARAGHGESLGSGAGRHAGRRRPGRLLGHEYDGRLLRRPRVDRRGLRHRRRPRERTSRWWTARGRPSEAASSTASAASSSATSPRGAGYRFEETGSTTRATGPVLGAVDELGAVAVVLLAISICTPGSTT